MVTQLVEALCYKLEGHQVESQMRWIFSSYLIIPAAIWPRGLSQSLIEMSTRNFPGSKKWPVYRADNLATIYEPNV
jgi:hypothetical protein